MPFARWKLPDWQRAFETLEERTVLSTSMPSGVLSAASETSIVSLSGDDPYQVAHLPASGTVPSLPDPDGIETVVQVSTVKELYTAAASLISNTKIELMPGVYQLTRPVQLHTGATNVVLRGATGNRDDVVLLGKGMFHKGVRHGIMVRNADEVLIADLSVGEVFQHPITLNPFAGANHVNIHNVRLFDGGEQLLKSNAGGENGRGVHDGLVQYSVFEYSTTARSSYTNAIDVHAGLNWLVRDNLFRNIRGPIGDSLAGPAILFWNQSKDTITERNVFLNTERGIAYGLRNHAELDHEGGIIRNNLFYRFAHESGDAGIVLWDSPRTQVLHNTVLLSATHSSAIEYRYADTTGVYIANNLTDRRIWQRNGASGVVEGNFTAANTDMFVDPFGEDFRLAPTAVKLIDKAVDSAQVQTDIFGELRPAGQASDIGADEFWSHEYDLNLDDVVFIEDLDTLTQAVFQQSDNLQYDVDHSGQLDANDVDHMVEYVFGTRRGDLNLDRVVRFEDFTRFANNFGLQCASWSDGDFDGDGIVGFSDFTFLTNNFGFDSQLEET